MSEIPPMPPAESPDHYRVLIRKNETQECRWHQSDCTFRKGDPREQVDQGVLFQFLENNFDCDCNRSLFFDLAGEVTDETALMDVMDRPCGETAYSTVQ